MKKVAHYRRVIWLQGANRVLQTVLTQRQGHIPQNQLHTFDVVDGQRCLVAVFRPQGQGVFLHLVVYEEGAGAAVIQTIAQANQANAGELPPPAGREYIISQVFCYSRGNNILWTTHNNLLRDASIFDLFRRLIESLGPRPYETGFQFQALLDQDAYRAAFDQGIEEIDLGLGDFQSTLERLVNGQRLPAMDLVRNLQALVGRRPNRREIQAAHMLEARRDADALKDG